MQWSERYDLVIGLEVHVQLDLATKAFAPESNEISDHPNTLISPVSLALPGALPVLNAKYLDAALKLGIAVDAQFPDVCFFDRKHYFYADLPKGYQITQDRAPFCSGGNIQTIVDGQIRPVRLHHIHMEEDAGKSIHDSSIATLLDYNRAGTPLLEIVTEPDLHSEKEVSACIEAVQQLVQYLGISSADMEKGMLRCDCNVSLKPKGQETLGTRCEIKNLNSKRFARRAIAREVERQVGLLDQGIQIEAQTMSYEVKSDRNVPIRDKETVHDYRYFPEPDLPVFEIKPERISALKADLPPLPVSFYTQFTSQYGLDTSNAMLISGRLDEAMFVRKYLNWSDQTKILLNLYLQRIRPWLQKNDWNFMEIEMRRETVLSYVELIQSGQVSASSGLQSLAPQIFESTSNSLKEIAGTLGLIVQSDEGSIQEIASTILAEYPGQVNAYRNGKKGLIGFFMGELMRRSEQKPNPALAKSTFEELLNSQS